MEFEHDCLEVYEAWAELVRPGPHIVRRYSRMRIGVEAAQFMPPCQMDFADAIRVELFQILRRRQHAIEHLNVEIMKIKKGAAIKLRIKSIQEFRLGHLSVGDGRENSSVFQEQIAAQGAL